MMTKSWLGGVSTKSFGYVQRGCSSGSGVGMWSTPAGGGRVAGGTRLRQAPGGSAHRPVEAWPTTDPEPIRGAHRAGADGGHVRRHGSVNVSLLSPKYTASFSHLK